MAYHAQHTTIVNVSPYPSAGSGRRPLDKGVAPECLAVKRLRNCESFGVAGPRDFLSVGDAVAVREEGQMEWFARPKRKPRSDKGSSKRKATDARFDGMPVLLPVC
jgi:hypothetical protein